MAIFKHKFYTAFSFTKKIDGQERIIEFSEGNHEPFRPAFLITKDEKVINVIKGLQAFKDGNILEDEEIKDEAPEDTWEPLHIYTGVTNTQSAKELLMTEHKANPDDLKNKADILAYARENFISFPDWR